MHGWTLLALDVEADEPAAFCDAAVAELRSWLADLLGFAALPRRVHHSFAPQGLSDVCWDQRGRIAIHTWPEWGKATIDLWAPAADVARRLDELIPQLASRYGLRVVAQWRSEAPDTVPTRGPGQGRT
jgi:S-adenosylmethionine/arginine decarboxylase-like enzyme